jgi:hypothetical protein
MKEWWGYFKYSNIDFIHLINGESFKNSSSIHSLTWEFMTRLTKKRIIAEMPKQDENNNNGMYLGDVTLSLFNFEQFF